MIESFPDQESLPTPKVEVEPTFADFVPHDFLSDPVGYFEREGKNVKKGENIVDESGIIREDPSAVKDLPDWKNNQGSIIKTVGKRVNTLKRVSFETNDPFYEYKILEKLTELGLPCARPITKAEQSGEYIFVTERIPGIRWPERDLLKLSERGYTEDDIANLINEAIYKMHELKVKFEEAGFIRNWKLEDMVFQVDVDNKKITSLVPTDWERTKLVNAK